MKKLLLLVLLLMAIWAIVKFGLGVDLVLLLYAAIVGLIALVAGSILGAIGVVLVVCAFVVLLLWPKGEKVSITRPTVLPEPAGDLDGRGTYADHLRLK